MKERPDEHAGLRLVRDFHRLIEGLPMPTPAAIDARLEELGYVGQPAGRRALCLMAHRHVRRLKYIYLDGVPKERLPPKDNHLLVGPTGCGKTFLVELLFGQILKLPTALVDITTFSETGYVGNDVTSVLTRLLYAADLNPLWAQVGVVCLDEFDKIAGGSNRALFAGAGTTKDVSGLGVQRELLKLLERGEVPVPTEFDHNTYQQKMMLRTDDIAFVACGAFSGLKAVMAARAGANIGFERAGRAPADGPDAIAVRYRREELEDTAVFQAYGFLPELIGRFTRVLPFLPLGAATLRRILAEQVLPGRARELELAGIELQVDAPVLDHIVAQALKRETGARGLASALSRHLDDAIYAAYSGEAVERVRVRLVDGAVRTTVEGPSPAPAAAAPPDERPQTARAAHAAPGPGSVSGSSAIAIDLQRQLC